MFELATWVATPFAGALLADLGARVMKIEPLSGDPMRGRFTNQDNAVRVNQGKESIAVNLQTAEGQVILRRLVQQADIVVHNYRPGVPERLGLDYATLHALKPSLVYVCARRPTARPVPMLAGPRSIRRSVPFRGTRSSSQGREMSPSAIRRRIPLPEVRWPPRRCSA